jgi:release factor glutamine methyltransferase
MGKVFQDIRGQLATRYERGEAQAMGFLLLEELFGLTKADVLMGKDDESFDAQSQSGMKRATELHIAVGRLMKGEPIQYVIGHTDFCGLRVDVGRGVLIPRQETEELVAAVEEFNPRSILDVGTCSGCIALALKHRLKEAQVTAMDISKEALKIARGNAERLGLDIAFERFFFISQ